MLFSIIIPVYNVAPYLRECLDSVLAQTFGDWESICVDDGSTDGSGAILDEYAAKDSRFKVIHQTNAGVSAARNCALEQMSGEWFLFLDGDDILRVDGLETFVDIARKGVCDGILVQPYVPVWDGAEILPRKMATTILVQDATKEDLIFGPYAANGFPFSRIYRKERFVHLRFPVGVKMAEDIHFWFDALCVPARWTILNAEYYLYRQRPDSVCGQKAPQNCAAILDSVLVAFSRIGGDIGLGEDGKRRYIERWPFSPSSYLRIFVKQYRELNSAERVRVFSKLRTVVTEVGGWPFEVRLRYELWLIEKGLGFLLPVSNLIWGVCNMVNRAKRLLRHVAENGPGFALGKVKRQLFHQGEYVRRQ